MAARTKVENADGKGMGWITFEDGIAYSRNVIAAKVARQLGDSTRAVVGDPVRRVAAPGLRLADRRRHRRRGVRPAARPGHRAVERDRPGQRLVRAGRGGHADPARGGVCRAAQRRDHGPAPRGQVHRRDRPADRDQGPGRRAGGQRRPCARWPTTSSTKSRSTATGRSCPATTSAARPARPRSGTPRRVAGSTTCSTTRSPATSPARRGSRTSSSSCASRRAPRPSPGAGTSRCRSCPSSCSGASRPTPSPPPTCSRIGRSRAFGERDR